MVSANTRNISDYGLIKSGDKPTPTIPNVSGATAKLCPLKLDNNARSGVINSFTSVMLLSVNFQWKNSKLFLNVVLSVSIDGLSLLSFV